MTGSSPSFPWPSILIWEITPQCTHHCAHCYNCWHMPGARTPVALKASARSSIIRNIAAAYAEAPGGWIVRKRPKLKLVNFTGGEPLLDDSLEETIAEIATAFPGTQSNVSTNGHLLTLQRARRLKEAGVTTVQVTILSPRPEIHDRMTGVPGSLSSTLRAIVSAKSAGLLVATFFVAMRQNIADWPGAAKLAIGAGTDALVFNRFQPGGRSLANWKGFTPAPCQLVTALKHAEELSALRPVNLGTLIPPCELRDGNSLSGSSAYFAALACPSGTASAYPCIGPDGALRPCNHSPVISGNLLDSDFATLLARSCISCKVVTPSPECRGCPDLATCGGGCPSARREAGEPIYALAMSAVTT